MAILSAKGEQTRQRIFDASVHLFLEKGYHQTTMRDIAKASGTSLGLAYRYYARKEEIMRALYLQLTQETMVASPLNGTIAERFQAALTSQLARLVPYRVGMAALFSVALDSQEWRSIAQDDPFSKLLYTIVTGATDRVKEDQVESFVILLYSTYTLILLFWLLDRTPQQATTQSLIQQLKEAYQFLRPALVLPFVSKSVAQLAAIIGPVLLGHTSSEKHS